MRRRDRAAPQPEAEGLGIGTRDIARAAAVLWLACGALVMATSYVLAFGAGADRSAIFGVGAVAVVIGVIVWFLPWDRLGRDATLALVPIACAVITAFNVTARDPWLTDVFFVVAWVWTGLAHKKWTCVVWSPVLVVSYLAPGIVRADAAGIASVVYVAPVAVVLGEVASWVARRLSDAEVQRQRAADRFAALVRHASEFVVVMYDGIVTYASPGVTRVLGYEPAAMIGIEAATLVHPDDIDNLRPWFDEEVRVDIATSYRARHADGEWRWIEGSFSDLRRDPAVNGIVINGRDVTERVNADAALRTLAMCDQLTGLPNRTSFVLELDERSTQAARRGERVGVVYIDLDGFKVVNDSLGHAVGDELLALLAGRLLSVMPDGHYLARLGGDEFVVIVPHGACDRVDHLAASVADAIAVPAHLGARRLVVGCSIGIDIRIPSDPAELLRHADLALYRAKALGRGRWVLFDETLARTAARRLDIETELRLAIERSQLVCHYQPEIDLGTGAMVGAEALVRWHHPTRGVLLPGEFIDVAEESGLIVDLGRFVLADACATAARLRRAAPGFVVACNISPRQIEDSSLVEEVTRLLALHSLAADALRLEVTETALVESSAQDTLVALRGLGVSLAIDDFGTGYSSLSYLDRLAVDVLKIDKSFLEPVADGTEHLPVVAAALAMAQSLHLHVVAEGVETPAHVALLQRLGCPSAQGFYFSRPVPAAEIARRVASGDARVRLRAPAAAS